MMYTRGHPEDYERWYRDLPGYEYEKDVLPFFKKGENQIGSFVDDGECNDEQFGCRAESLAEHTNERYDSSFAYRQVPFDERSSDLERLAVQIRTVETGLGSRRGIKFPNPRRKRRTQYR